MFHVWRFDKRRRMLYMQTSKAYGRWDQARAPAVWDTRQAAVSWARAHVGQGNYKVFKCEGDRCGMATCR